LTAPFSSKKEGSFLESLGLTPNTMVLLEDVEEVTEEEEGKRRCELGLWF